MSVAEYRIHELLLVKRPAGEEFFRSWEGNVVSLVNRLRRKAAALERNEKTPYVPDVMRQAADALCELRAALIAETEQHEAFYVQSGRKSEVHERGIAAAYELADKSQKAHSER